MRIDPSDLATFLAIARHRSFRAAATELGVSASALSHALRNIEERLDLQADQPHHAQRRADGGGRAAVLADQSGVPRYR